MKFLSKIRFLPITIFFATLMLTVKISDIWDGVDGLTPGSVDVASAQAQQEGAPAPADAPAVADEATAEGESEEAFEEEEGGPSEEKLLSRLVTDDPTLLTPEEIDLLQQLSERRKILEERAREIDMREGLLKAAESRIDKKVDELRTLRETIAGLIKTFDEQQDAKLLSLVKIYENMKPGQAARIFENLELDTLLEVAERMKERKLAPIMAKMQPEKAREMTVELRRLRELPKVGEEVGG